MCPFCDEVLPGSTDTEVGVDILVVLTGGAVFPSGAGWRDILWDGVGPLAAWTSALQVIVPWISKLRVSKTGLADPALT